MKTQAAMTGDQLANALRSLGVEFIMGAEDQKEPLHRQPARLILSLAQSQEGRLRLALIPLLLEHPEFASHVRLVAARLAPAARLNFQCYYTAAVWLQQLHQGRLTDLLGSKPKLPDFFSHEIGVDVSIDPEENLKNLSKRQRVLSEVQVNWLGTYHHAAQVMLAGLELQKA